MAHISVPFEVSDGLCTFRPQGKQSPAEAVAPDFGLICDCFTAENEALIWLRDGAPQHAP